MKRKTIISLSAYFLHAISVFIYVYSAYSYPNGLIFVLTYLSTFPLLLSLLSFYDVIESFINKSYKKVTTWICCAAGLIITALSVGVLFDFFSNDDPIIFSVVIACSALIVVCRIGEFIRRLTKDNVFTNAIYICSGILALIIAIVLVINAIPKYNENWIIGKTAEEIQERYGEFDYVSYRYEMDEDHNYILDEDGNKIIIGWFSGGYITKEERTGFFGTIYREYFKIEFDKNGIAVEIVKNWVNGKEYL